MSIINLVACLKNQTYYPVLDLGILKNNYFHFFLDLKQVFTYIKFYLSSSSSCIMFFPSELKFKFNLI